MLDLVLGNMSDVRRIYENECFKIDASLNDHNDSFAHVAAEYGHVDILNYFHRMGCSIFKKNTVNCGTFRIFFSNRSEFSVARRRSYA
mmetsp:Transcript_12196/g.13329  ORF Transcript_12196/g.13329 Transcript_12196/m.13329 type:complete len:88 (-) Transcript_12196:388-651(-)